MSSASLQWVGHIDSEKGTIFGGVLTHTPTLFYVFAILICRPRYPFSAAKKSRMKKTNCMN